MTEVKTQKKLEAYELEALATHSRDDLIAFAIWNQRDYIPAWFHKLIADKLMAVERGEIKRLMIFLPPRHGKSRLANVHFPAWYIGKHPDKEIVTTSYNADLATEFGFLVRDEITNRPYKALFGTTLREDSQSKSRMITNQGGSYSAIGVGGALTGKGADILLIDDPIKGRQDADSKLVRDITWQWYTSTAYTRLYKESAIIVIQTRWHLDDLAGRLLEQMKIGGEQWEIINLPAIATEDNLYNGKLMRREGDALWEDQFNLKQLTDIKGVLGLYEFSALYQQNPIAAETQEFKPEWIQKVSWAEVKKMVTRKFLCVDTAISRTDNADSTGLSLNFVDEKNHWHLKAWKVRVNPKQLIDLLFQLHEEYGIEKIGVEETVYLLTIKPFFDEECRKRNIFPYVVPLKHHHTQKETRIRGLVPRYETKSVWHIEESCIDLEEEMLQFPKGKHDDVLDATAYQLQLAQQAHKKKNVKVIPFRNTSFA